MGIKGSEYIDDFKVKAFDLDESILDAMIDNTLEETYEIFFKSTKNWVDQLGGIKTP